MRDARFTPTPALPGRVVDMLDKTPLDDRDTNGDRTSACSGKIASRRHQWQFHTPRHIIELMVGMTAPKPGDETCDRVYRSR